MAPCPGRNFVTLEICTDEGIYAAALHFDLWVPILGLQEYMRPTEATDEVFPHAFTFGDGYLHSGDEPGLGVDCDEEGAEEYLYERASLPVNRLEDGTMFHW